MEYRTEQDTMGSVLVQDDCYYGAGTQRAVENFPISGLRVPLSVIHALAMIKKHAAHVNASLGLLPAELAKAVQTAAQEVVDGTWDRQFVVDVFQTGSGTSTNMNVNEVIAGRANEILTGNRGGKTPVHPNDHVNLGQSTNDAFPSAIHMAAAVRIQSHLMESLRTFHFYLRNKAEEFSDVIKIGRTHLQDAVPVTLGQEFGGYARQAELGMARLDAVLPRLIELPLGGTAVGTGVNAHPEFARRVIALISEETHCPFRECENHFEALAARDALVETSGALKTVAVSTAKIANDIRWLACGPRSGFGEITLPSLQPGSSIMPGKVNPVLAESLLQVVAQVIGNDTVITYAGQAGNFELNVMMPVMAYNLMQSIEILGKGIMLFARNYVDRITANEEVCASTVERSLALSTYLVPLLGYDKASALAKEAFAHGESIREAALRTQVCSPEELDSLLGPAFRKP